jgi:two-component system, LytTR family, response regulator
MQSTHERATWHHGGAMERLEAPPNRLAPPARPANDLRIVRIETARQAPHAPISAGAASAAGSASEASERLVLGAKGAKIILRTRGRVIVVDEGEIDWVDAAGNYVRVHVGPARHQVRGTLKDVEAVLTSSGDRFVRVHRSTIVNLHSVREFVRTPYGDLIALLRNGQRLAVGRVYRSRIEALLATRL